MMEYPFFWAFPQDVKKRLLGQKKKVRLVSHFLIVKILFTANEMVLPLNVMEGVCVLVQENRAGNQLFVVARYVIESIFAMGIVANLDEIAGKIAIIG